MPNTNYDFSGWASRYDIPCSDGRTIKKDAFKDMDGQTVPLVWGHEHGSPNTILGCAFIEHRDEGPYIWGSFNDSEAGTNAKEAVKHGDIKYLSIYANKLKEQRTAAGLRDVYHGVIREVSLVYGGANPGAYIDNAVLAHGDGTFEELGDEAIISTGVPIDIDIDTTDDLSHEDKSEKEDEEVADEKKETADGDKTVQDVWDSLTDEQKQVVYYMIGEAVADAKGGDGEAKHEDEGEETMKYNAFENGTGRKSNVICHADQEEILARAKNSSVGTFKNALNEFLEENALQHTDDEETGLPVNGFDNNDLIDSTFTSFTAILPEYKDVRPGVPPELITDDMGWISTIMGKVHKSPISRIRTGQVDIRKAEQLRAKGYQKGKKKKYTGNFKLARRTTDPQTIYVKNVLHRDDIIDITDFDYVKYLYDIDMMMLKEEIATAIMFGDGRDAGDADKIFPEHIRPIWTDDELYTIHWDIEKDNVRAEIQGDETESYFGENYIQAEAMINACLYSREDFRGTGTPDMYIDPHMLNVMLLARDRNGRRIYSSKAELASAFNVGNIYTVEKMKDKVRNVTVDGTTVGKKLLCMIVNLADYQIGSTKGGEITHFTQFDIDFNQQKSLLETRLSGALTRIQSAIAIEETVEAVEADDNENENDSGLNS